MFIYYVNGHRSLLSLHRWLTGSVRWRWSVCWCGRGRVVMVSLYHALGRLIYADHDCDHDWRILSPSTLRKIPPPSKKKKIHKLIVDLWRLRRVSILRRGQKENEKIDLCRRGLYLYHLLKIHEHIISQARVLVLSNGSQITKTGNVSLSEVVFLYT